MTLLDHVETIETNVETNVENVENVERPAIVEKRPDEWVDVCAFADLVPDVGVCALVAGKPVAVFRCWPHDELFAIGNIDPYSSASVMSRGIVGTIAGRPMVASPIFKNRFDLHTGEAIGAPDVRLPVHDVHLVNGRVTVRSVPVRVRTVTRS